MTYATRRGVRAVPLVIQLLEGTDRPVRKHARRSLLGHAYWTFWTATAISSVGDGLVTIALPLLAASITHDGLALGGLLAALRLPWLFVALPLGALADRVDRRRMAVIVETVRTVTLALLAVAIGAGLRSLPFLYAIAFVLGTLEAAFVAATSASVPDLVPRDLYARANGHLNAANTAGEDFLGIGLGGLAFVALASLPFIFDSLSFAISAVLLMAALPRAKSAVAVHRAGAIPDRAGDSARAGLRYVARQPALRVLLASNATLAFFQAMMMGVLVAFALTVLHVGGAGYGLMLSIAALGMVAGGVLTGRIVARIGNPGALIVGATGAGLAYLILAYSMVAPVAVAALALEGFSVILGRSAITTMRHELVPTSLQGRTNTVFRSVIYGVVPFGAVTGGLVAHLSSLRTAIASAGVLQLLAVILMARRAHRRLAEAASDAEKIIELDELDLRMPRPADLPVAGAVARSSAATGVPSSPR